MVKEVYKQKINESLDHLFRASLEMRNGSDFKKFLDPGYIFDKTPPSDTNYLYLI